MTCKARQITGPMHMHCSCHTSCCGDAERGHASHCFMTSVKLCCCVRTPMRVVSQSSLVGHFIPASLLSLRRFNIYRV